LASLVVGTVVDRVSFCLFGRLTETTNVIKGFLIQRLVVPPTPICGLQGFLFEVERPQQILARNTREDVLQSRYAREGNLDLHSSRGS
jgi:hypothetical protein